jgi:pimeloyl-ACP methyl ester carboxylesterase
MSTTEDARDMDVLRRAVGDSKLTYFGESFGSCLGELYANMFPDRVRAVELDGIVDPQAYSGTPATARVPVFDRIGAPAASYRALHELLVRCQNAGPSRCTFADADTPARFDHLADRLKARPLPLAAPGVEATIYTYANLVHDTEQWLHGPAGYLGLFADLTDLAQLTAPGGTGPDHDAVVRRFLGRHPAPPSVAGYDNRLEAFSVKACTDSSNAADAASWPSAAAAADRSAPYFGAYYAWLSAQRARHLDRSGRGRLPRPVRPPHPRAGPRDRWCVGSGHELRQRREGGGSAAQQPPARQRQLGSRVPRHIRLCRQRGARLRDRPAGRSTEDHSLPRRRPTLRPTAGFRRHHEMRLRVGT